MLSISRVITVNISRTTSTVARAGFGVALVMGAAASGVFASGTYVQEYSSASAMLTDGFVATDSEYLAALSYFSQTTRPTKILIGVGNPVATAKTVTYTGTLTAGTVAIVVNGTSYSTTFASDEDTTMAALAALVQADDDVATAAWLAGVLTITSTAGKDVRIGTITLGTGQSAAAIAIPTQATSTFATDLQAIRDQNDDWYMLYLADYGYADVVAAFASIEALSRIMGVTVYDPQALVSGDTTNLAYVCSNANYDRSFCLFSDTVQHSAIGWAGGRLAKDPGSQTWKFKTIAGATGSTLTETHATNLETINCNWYSELGGQDITSEGIMGSGEFIDVIRLVDWTEARILEEIYSGLTSVDKIPFTDVGGSFFDSAIRGVLRQGIANGGYVEDSNFAVTVPKVADISAVDKALRAFTGITFYATLSGAVHSAAVAGTVSV